MSSCVCWRHAGLHDCANRILRVCPGLCCTLRTLYLHARCASRLVRDPPRKRGRKATAMALPAPAAGVKLAVFKGTIPVVFANITVLLSLGLVTFPAVSSINVTPNEQGAPCARGCNWQAPAQNKQNKTDRDLDHRSFKLGRKWLPGPAQGVGSVASVTSTGQHHGLGTFRSSLCTSSHGFAGSRVVACTANPGVCHP